MDRMREVEMNSLNVLESLNVVQFSCLLVFLCYACALSI